MQTCQRKAQTTLEKMHTIFFNLHIYLCTCLMAVFEIFLGIAGYPMVV